MGKTCAETGVNVHAGNLSHEELARDQGTSPTGSARPDTEITVEAVDEGIEDWTISADNNSKTHNQAINLKEKEAGPSCATGTLKGANSDTELVGDWDTYDITDVEKNRTPNGNHRNPTTVQRTLRSNKWKEA